MSVGLVHLGLGAFHRAHQAVFTEDAAAATGENRWGILGVTQRSARVVEQLAPQDGLYGVLTKGTAETSLRLVGSLRDVAFPGDRHPSRAHHDRRADHARRDPDRDGEGVPAGGRRPPGPGRPRPGGRPRRAGVGAARRPDGHAGPLTARPAPAGARPAREARRREPHRGLLRQPRRQRSRPGDARRRHPRRRAARRPAPGVDRRVGALPGDDGRPDRARDDRRAPRRGAVAPRAERRRPGDRRTVHAVGHPGHVRRAAPGVGARRGDAHRGRRTVRARQAAGPERQPLDARLPRGAAGARDDRAGGRRPGPGGDRPGARRRGRPAHARRTRRHGPRAVPGRRPVAVRQPEHRAHHRAGRHGRVAEAAAAAAGHGPRPARQRGGARPRRPRRSPPGSPTCGRPRRASWRSTAGRSDSTTRWRRPSPRPPTDRSTRWPTGCSTCGPCSGTTWPGRTRSGRPSAARSRSW